MAAHSVADDAARLRAMFAIRIGITVFVTILLSIVALGWVWTGSHQAPALRTASHVVLALAAASGVFALVKIWRSDSPKTRSAGRQ